MQVQQTELPGVLLITPRVFEDDRGFFYESFNATRFREATGVSAEFVQDNHSKSARGVIRGLHYQLPPAAQGKLVRVIVGSIFDVVVDIRRSSPTFGEWISVELNSENKRQLWIPVGFAHGFQALAEDSEVVYKATNYYSPNHDRSIAWDDPDLQIPWPLGAAVRVSPKDSSAQRLAEAQVFD